LVDAFASGDYRRVYNEAPELAARATDPAVREAAKTLYERLQPDPLAKIILLGAVILLALMAAWWITHAGPPRSTGGATHAVSAPMSPPGISESKEVLIES